MSAPTSGQWLASACSDRGLAEVAARARSSMPQPLRSLVVYSAPVLDKLRALSKTGEGGVSLA